MRNAWLIVVMLLAAGCARSYAPALSGETCDELARNYGSELERRSLHILDSAQWPKDPGDVNRRGEVAQQISDSLRESSLALARAVTAARDSAQLEDCSPERFLSIAEQELGPRFRKEVPPALDTSWNAPKPDWPFYRKVIQGDIEVALQAE